MQRTPPAAGIASFHSTTTTKHFVPDAPELLQESL